MSWTRPSWDECDYRKELRQSTSQLDYNLDPNKFFNCTPCRTELGIFGGNNVSLTKDNLVNTESELRNQTRQYSRCPERKYLPECEECDPNEGLPCGSWDCRDREEKEHLPTCNIIQYQPRIEHSGFSLRYPGCPVENISSVDGQKMKYQPYINPIQFNDSNNGNCGTPGLPVGNKEETRYGSKY